MQALTNALPLVNYPGYILNHLPIAIAIMDVPFVFGKGTGPYYHPFGELRKTFDNQGTAEAGRIVSYQA